MYKALIRPVFFLFKPETAHHIALSLFGFMYKIPPVRNMLRKTFQVEHPSLECHVMGLTFKNPVGLAAGFDKNARYIDQMDTLGFGFVEIGTLTPEPQPGNPKPRMFRLYEDKSLINRMGFNNEGVTEAVKRLKQRTSSLLVGGNIGKNKATPNEQAIDDYAKCFHALYDVVDYFTVNVSSPNTPDLRDLQEKEPLQKLLAHLQALNRQKPAPKPILLKIAPDLNNHQLDDIIDICLTLKIDGIIATNTTIDREGLRTDRQKVQQMGAGGLSGKAVRKRATEVIRYLHEQSKGKLPIIGVGGIFTARDAIEKLEAGASLVQVYTGFIYEGPGMAKKINKALMEVRRPGEGRPKTEDRSREI